MGLPEPPTKLAVKIPAVPLPGKGLPPPAKTSAPPPAAKTQAPPPAAETQAPPPAAETQAPPPAAETQAPPAEVKKKRQSRKPAAERQEQAPRKRGRETINSAQRLFDTFKNFQLKNTDSSITMEIFAKIVIRTHSDQKYVQDLQEYLACATEAGCTISDVCMAAGCI